MALNHPKSSISKVKTHFACPDSDTKAGAAAKGWQKRLSWGGEGWSTVQPAEQEALYGHRAWVQMSPPVRGQQSDSVYSSDTQKNAE